MADKVQKIREEVVRMHNLLPVMDSDNISVNYADRICTTLEMYIDSMQKEEIPPKFPMIAQKKCMFTKDSYTDEDRKVLCDGCEEECEYSKKEEPVSIWHDANIELPRKDKEVLALVIRPNLRAYVAFPSGHGTLYSLFGIIDINDVSKWCYIDDILNLSNVKRTVKEWSENWKPTEEQVEALGYAIKLCDGEGEKGRYYLQFLYKLMNDFKAL